MSKSKITREEALAFHLEPTPGKFEITATVPMTTQRDLSLAYSPGVAVPCEAIAANPETAYDYTNKGNLVAVISNGTAILGLGNLRPKLPMFDHLFLDRSGCESTSTSGRCNVGVLNLNDLAQYSEATFRSRGTEIGLRNRWAEV